MPFLAAIEVDQRQAIISASDKLKEMMGGSYNIAATVKKVAQTLEGSSSTRLVMPVSGATWLTSDSIEDLNRVLWECRREIVENLDLPCTFAIVSYDDLDKGKSELDDRVRKNKDSKGGEDGEFSSPLAAACQIQPKKHANHWFPARLNDDQWQRRSLVSSASLQRQEVGHKPMQEFLKEFDEAKDWETPNEFRDLVASGQDQFIALIKADGDGMTELVSHIKWSGLAQDLGLGDREVWQRELEEVHYGHESAATNDKPSPEQALAIFSNSVEKIQKQALKQAVSSVLRRQKGGKRAFPVVPIVRAGEDTAILCRRDLALEVALKFAEEYGELAERHGIFQAALRAANRQGKVALSLSVGILFAKQGYPFEILWELADELVGSAKAARANAEGTTGFLDFFWFASSGRSTIEEIRDESVRNGERSLVTRPWSLQQARRQIDLAKKLDAVDISPGKWAQLDSALRFKPGFAELAFQRWLQHLSENQQKAVRDSLHESAENLGLTKTEGPWLRSGMGQVSPLLEFVEILKTMEGRTVVQHA